MRISRRPRLESTRKVRLARAAAPVLETLESRQLLTTVYWAGGSGVWDTSAKNKSWRVGGPAGRAVAWSNSAGYSAVFADSRSAVKVNAAVEVNSIRFTGVGDQIVGRRNIVLGGSIEVDAGASATIGTTLGGSVGLHKIGGGSLRVTAPNGFVGSIVVDGGTLDIAASQTAASARPVTINAGGAVLVDATNGLVPTTAIGPTVTVDGGTLTTGDNVVADLYSLTLNGGTLDSGVSAGEWRFNASTISVTDDSSISAGLATGGVTMTVAPGVTAAVTGSLGDASVVENGNGTIVLTGDDSGTTFNVCSGTLQAGDGTTAAALGTATLYDAGLVVFDSPGVESYGGSITGPGSVQVTGGTLVLTNPSDYTGGTAISDGTLSVNTSTGSATGGGAVVVWNGGTLTGNGTAAGAVTIQGGGTLAAGVGGSIHLGRLVTMPGSDVHVTVSPADDPAGIILVDGLATLNGGTLTVGGQSTGPVTVIKALSPGDGTLPTGSLTIDDSTLGGGNQLTTIDLGSVGPVGTSIALGLSSTTETTAQTVTLSAAVAPVNGGVPTGTVTFFDGSAVLATVPLGADLTASLGVTFSTTGDHAITATYGGDAAYAAASSAAATTTVTPAAVPKPIATLNVIVASSSTVYVLWPNDGTSHTGFAVYRSSAGTAATKIATVTANARVYVDSGLSQGVVYTYQVIATDDGGCSPLVTVTTPLPAPAYLGPSYEPTYPAGFSTFQPPVAATVPAGAGSPQVDEYTRTATPDSTITLTAESLTNSTLGPTAAATGTGFLAYGQTTGANGTLAHGAIQTVDGRAASVTLPSTLPADSLYFVWPKNTDSTGTAQYSTPMVVNGPELWWADTTRAAPGGTVSVYGRNLALSTGNGKYQSWAYIKGTSNALGLWIQAATGMSGSADVNPYKVDFTLPSDLPVGNYVLWMNNGTAGHYSWTSSVPVTVAAAPTQTAPVVVGGVNEATIQLSLVAAATLASLGTPHVVDVLLPNGTFAITTPLLIPGNVHLVGSGATVLQVPAGENLNEAIDFASQGQAGLQNLTINADNYGVASSITDGDSRQPAVIQVGGYGQVLDHVVVSAVNSNARSAEDVNSSTPSIGLLVTDSTFVGPGMLFVGADDVSIDGNTFVGAGAGDASIFVFNADGISVTRNTVRNLSDDTSLQFSSAARFFWTGSSGSNLYLANNSSVNLFPVAALASGLNGGEQILSEADMTGWEGSPLSANGSSITLPLSAGNPAAPWMVTVGAGTGLGQTRAVTGSTVVGNTVVVTLSSPWAVNPAPDSIVALTTSNDHFVVYGNNLSGDGRASFTGNSSGIQLGGTNLVIADNTVKRLETGIALWSASKYGTIGTGQNAALTYFDVIDGNTVSDVQYGLRSITASLAASEPVDLMLGNVWRNNTVSDVHPIGMPGDLPTGISVSDYLVVPLHQTTTSVFEHNTVTAPIGITFTPGGNQAPAANASTTADLLRGNAFTSDGSVNSVAVLSTVTETGFAKLTGDTYSGFTAVYNLAGPVDPLLAPARAVSVVVAPGGTAAVNLPVQISGATASAWSVLNSSALPAWVTVSSPVAQPSTEATNSLLPLAINAAGLGVGTYTTTLKLAVDGVETADVTVSVKVVS